MTTCPVGPVCGLANSAEARGTFNDQEFARVAHALSHPARLAIVRRLTARDECVAADIFEEIDLAQSTVSEHLRVLRDAEVVQSTVQGNRTYYCLVASTLGRFESTVGELRESRHVPREPGTVC